MFACPDAVSRATTTLEVGPRHAPQLPLAGRIRARLAPRQPLCSPARPLGRPEHLPGTPVGRSSSLLLSSHTSTRSGLTFFDEAFVWVLGAQGRRKVGPSEALTAVNTDAFAAACCRNTMHTQLIAERRVKQVLRRRRRGSHTCRGKNQQAEVFVSREPQAASAFHKHLHTAKSPRHHVCRSRDDQFFKFARNVDRWLDSALVSRSSGIHAISKAPHLA